MKVHQEQPVSIFTNSKASNGRQVQELLRKLQHFNSLFPEDVLPVGFLQLCKDFSLP